jgi:hypothetical protein
MFGNKPPEFNFWNNAWNDKFNIGSEQEIPVDRPTRSVSPIPDNLSGLFGLMKKSKPQYRSFQDDVMHMMPEGFVPPERNFYPTHERTPYQGYGPMETVMPSIGEFGTGDPYEYEFDRPSRGMLAPPNTGPQGVSPMPNRQGTGTGFGGY